MQESNGQGNYQQATLFDKGVLAGLFMGEGTVGLSKSSVVSLTTERFYPRIRISNTDPKIIGVITSILKLLSIPYHVETYTRKGYRISWTVSVVGWKRTKKFVMLFKDLTVGDKKIQLDVLSKLLDSRLTKAPKDLYSEEELEFMAKIGSLNKKNRKSSETNEQFPAEAGVI